MAFRQQLARRYVDTKQAYEAETQQMLQAWRAETKPKFIQACEAAADRRLCFCEMTVEVPHYLWNRGMRFDDFKQTLQELLMELGFPEGKVKSDDYNDEYRIEVEWRDEDATGSIPEPHPQTSRGTCTTCPICHEHRPAVALIPCGHVVCRDCHRCQQLRQCPMCRGPITSATNGLFMDWREHRGQWWHWMWWMDLERFLPLPFWAKIEKFLQFWRVSWVSSCSWLAWLHSKVLDLLHRWSFAKINISSFCFNVTSAHSKNHVEFGISASWAFLCGISSSPNLEEDLVNLPFSSTKCLQCHLVHCRPGTDITSCYNRTIKTPEEFSHFGNSSRMIPCNSKPKSGFVALTQKWR